MCCGHDGGTARNRTLGVSRHCDGGRHEARPVSPTETTEEQWNVETEGLREMNDGENMDEDKEESRFEEIGYKDQKKKIRKRVQLLAPTFQAM